MPPSFKIHSFIVCDQVRVEAGGRLFIIGLYPGRQVGIKQGQAALSFYVEFKFAEPNVYNGEFAIFDETGTIRLSQGIILRDAGTMSTGAFISTVLFEVPYSQKFELRWRFSANESYQYVGDFFIAAPNAPVSLIGGA